MITLIKLATNDQTIVADITKRILLGESLEDIWFDDDTDSTRILLEKFHVDPNIQNVFGNSILNWACINSRKDFVKLLLEHGADPNTTGTDKWTALDNAGNEEIKNLLKQYGAKTYIHEKII